MAVMDKAAAVRALGALAHPIRLDLFRALVVAGPEGLTPGALVESFELPYPKVGFHLKELAIAGLVTQEQSGRYVIYRAAFEQVDGLLGYLTENCCAGAACATGSSPAASCKC
jgi:DNA-binding transcriptional ArsR family regulator